MEDARPVEGVFAGPLRVPDGEDEGRIWQVYGRGPDGAPVARELVLVLDRTGAEIEVGAVALLTVPEVAKFLRLTAGRVRQLVRAGRLGKVHKVVVLGRVVGLIRWDEVARYRKEDRDRRRKPAEQVLEG